MLFNEKFEEKSFWIKIEMDSDDSASDSENNLRLLAESAGDLKFIDRSKYFYYIVEEYN